MFKRLFGFASIASTSQMHYSGPTTQYAMQATKAARFASSIFVTMQANDTYRTALLPRQLSLQTVASGVRCSLHNADLD